MSGFHARGGCAIAYLSQNLRGRVACDNRNRNDAPARGFHLFASDNLIARPVATLYQHIRKQTRDHLSRRRLIKYHHCIHTFEPRENFSAFALWQDGASRALQLTHTGIAVDANDERIAKSASLLQTADVPG